MSVPQEWTRAVSLLAIDPGNCTGWCLLFDLDGGWHIDDCGVATPDQRDWPNMKRVDLVVIETPEDYLAPGVPLNALLKLSRTTGRYEERFAERAKRLVQVTPHDWKGSVKKEIMTARIEAALSPRDRTLVDSKGLAKSYKHNMLDAVGLGFWATKQPWIREPRNAPGAKQVA